ncbi:TonB family protein [Hymenobacter roseosalivarius DSM 11622]|uniref:TonB family protein n=1 Tax=Hymenobacter roseosalivarius DSM 11622 TaxID=645990 RepID=A0A1W1VRK1_9BACT|nr:energy transducer TonB [Hymenobacter roseosalivarius]SMB95883.1 TonB family protein [Hymenobacter roseosalivarius DSM 11622]
MVGISGRLQDVQVAKSAHPLLDAEAVRAVGTLPAHTPGKQSGRAVPVAYTLPITFELPANVEQILAARAAAQSGKLATSSAQFPGGPEALLAYLAAVPYPEVARASQAEGRIFVRCKISAEGKAEYIAAIRPAESPNRRKAPLDNSAIAQPLLIKAAEQAVATMLLWKPAVRNGIPAASTQMLPVYFYLTPTPSAPVYVYADQMPVFEGAADDEQLVANIQRSIRYPADALRNRKGGIALAYFEVDEQGTMSPVKIIQPVYSAIDEEVARAVSRQKAVKPAMHQGKPVKVFYVVPITFAIL